MLSRIRLFRMPALVSIIGLCCRHHRSVEVASFSNEIGHRPGVILLDLKPKAGQRSSSGKYTRRILWSNHVQREQETLSAFKNRGKKYECMRYSSAQPEWRSKRQPQPNRTSAANTVATILWCGPSQIVAQLLRVVEEVRGSRRTNYGRYPHMQWSMYVNPNRVLLEACRWSRT